MHAFCPIHETAVNPSAGRVTRDTPKNKGERVMQCDSPAYGISSMPARQVLAANLAALMSTRKGLASLNDVENEAMRKGHPIGRSTVDRAKKGKTAINLDNLEAIARAFDLEAWQLLVPSFNPTNPPVLRSIGEVEDGMYKRIAELAKEIADLQEPKP